MQNDRGDRDEAQAIDFRDELAEVVIRRTRLSRNAWELTRHPLNSAARINGEVFDIGLDNGANDGGPSDPPALVKQPAPAAKPEPQAIACEPMRLLIHRNKDRFHRHGRNLPDGGQISSVDAGHQGEHYGLRGQAAKAA